MNKASTPEKKWRIPAVFQRIWSFLTTPSSRITDVGEQRSARLAASFLFIITVFNFVGAVARIPRLGLTASVSGGLGFSILVSIAAYLVSRTALYRLAVFIFSVSFSSTAYTSIIAQGNEANFSALVLVYVPIGLIVASSFLSPWAVFLLTGLNIGGIIITRYFGVTPPTNIGAVAGITTTIGLVLIALSGFRSRSEEERLNEVRNINRKLEDLTVNLEKRVDERTAELEIANQQTSRRAAQLQAITELAEAIATLQELGEILPTVTKLINERFGFYHVGVFLIDSERENAILQAANSEGGQKMLARGHRLRLGTGVVGYSAQMGQPRIALDVGADAVFFNNPDLRDTRSEVALPLKSRGETIGVLDVQSTEARAFSNDDLQVLTALANQVSIAIENARLLSETRGALTQVQEVYNEFTRTEWGRTARQMGQSGFRYQTGRIETMEDSVHTPEVVSAVQNGVSVTGTSGDSKEERSIVAVPVKLRGEVIGVLQIEANEAGKKWHADDIGLVEAVAERAATAMENARLFQDARRRAAKESMISEASARISSALNIENILQTTAEELERVLGGSEVLIQFQSREKS